MGIAKLTAMVLVVFSLFISAARAGEEGNPGLPKEVVQGYAARIQRILPKGWSVQTGRNELKIARDEQVEWYGTISLPPHRNLAELKTMGFIQKTTYTITLAYAPPIAPAKLEEMRSENRKTSERLDKLETKMAHFWGKGLYVPRNEEERKLVAEHDKLEATLYRIPDFAKADAGIFLSDSMGEPDVRFYSDTVATECKQVCQAVKTALASSGKP